MRVENNGLVRYERTIQLDSNQVSLIYLIGNGLMLELFASIGVVTYLNTAAALAAFAAAAALPAASSAAAADDDDDFPPRSEERASPGASADCEGIGGSGRCSWATSAARDGAPDDDADKDDCVDEDDDEEEELGSRACEAATMDAD
jgi:hypothetical protein